MIIRPNNYNFQCYFSDNLFQETEEFPIFDRNDFYNLDTLSGITVFNHHYNLPYDSECDGEMEEVLKYIANRKFFSSYTGFKWIVRIYEYCNKTTHYLARKNFQDNVPIDCLHIKNAFIDHNYIDTGKQIAFYALIETDKLIFDGFFYYPDFFLPACNNNENLIQSIFNNYWQGFNNVYNLNLIQSIANNYGKGLTFKIVVSNGGVFIDYFDIMEDVGYYVYAEKLLPLYEEIQADFQHLNMFSM